MERTRGERLSGMLATNSNKFDHQTQVLPSMCVRMYGYVAPPSTGVSSKILEWVAMSSSRGIFPTQGRNPDLPHCGQILYQLSHMGSPRILEVGRPSLLQGLLLTQESN